MILRGEGKSKIFVILSVTAMMFMQYAAALDLGGAVLV